MRYIIILMIIFFIQLEGEVDRTRPDRTIFEVIIVDTQNTPIPWVIIQSDSYSTVSDSLGRANIIFDAEVYTFSRMGYQSTKRTSNQIRTNNIIILHPSPFTTDEYTVTSPPHQTALRMTSNSQKYNISDLKKTYHTASDILNDLVQVETRGVRLSGERQTISLGGHQSRHTLIMLDNIVLNPSGQAVDLSSIPASQITSVEIVKNNVSVESGSGGIAGMIIFHTKGDRKANQVTYSLSVGSFGSVKNMIGLEISKENIFIRFNTSQLHADNDFKYTYRNKEYTRAYNKKNIFNLGTDISYTKVNHSVSLSSRYQRFNKQTPGPLNMENQYLKAFQVGYVSNTSLSYSAKFHLFSFDTQAYHIKNHSIYNNTAAPIAFSHMKDENKQTIQGFKSAMRQEYEIKNITFATNLGGEYKNETFLTNDLLHNKNSIAKIKQNIGSGFISQTIKKDFYRWIPELIASGRIDNSDIFDQNESWRIEFNNNFYAYIPFQIKSSYGNSYTLPSFYDLYYQGDSQTSGNPDLLPEKSSGYRIEASTTTNPSLGVAQWHNKTDNLIYWHRTHLGWKPNNMEKAEITSQEFWGEYVINNQKIMASYTKTDPKNKTEGYLYDKYIVFTPLWNFSAQLNLKAGYFSQNFIYTAQGPQYTTPDQLIKTLKLKQYDIFDTQTMIEFSIGKIKYNFIFNVYNWFDTKYENYHYLPEPGRHWEGFMSFEFRV